MIFFYQIEQKIIQLYRGDLPLYKTYWVYYFFMNIVISIPVFVIVRFTNFVYTLTIILLIKFIYYFISCIGVWKSSQKYQGNKVFSFLARFAVVIELSMTILNVQNVKILYGLM